MKQLGAVLSRVVDLFHVKFQHVMLWKSMKHVLKPSSAAVTFQFDPLKNV